MRIGLANIALELFKSKKFNSVNTILDMGSKEMRFSYDQISYAFDQAGIKFNKKTSKNSKFFLKVKEYLLNTFGKN